MATTGTALIVVDVQYDFMYGSLTVPDADAVLAPILAASAEVEHVVLTRDWHPADHFSFSDDPQFVDKSWPPHCVQYTQGAEIHPRLLEAFPDAPIFSKGADSEVEAYSGFDGVDEDGFGLDEWLGNHDVRRVLVVGLATDYCVKATAIDAVHLGYETTVVADAVRGVSPVTTAVAAGEMADEGCWISSMDSILTIGI